MQPVRFSGTSFLSLRTVSPQQKAATIQAALNTPFEDTVEVYYKAGPGGDLTYKHLSQQDNLTLNKWDVVAEDALLVVTQSKSNTARGMVNGITQTDMMMQRIAGQLGQNTDYAFASRTMSPKNDSVDMAPFLQRLVASVFGDERAKEMFADKPF